MSLPVLATSFRFPRSSSQEVEQKDGYVQYEVEPGFTIRLRQDIDPATDPKKLKRLHNFYFYFSINTYHINETLINFSFHMQLYINLG